VRASAKNRACLPPPDRAAVSAWEHRRDAQRNDKAGLAMSPGPAIIEIALRRRIWRVTRDGVFYGDYRSKRHAVESAEAAALALRQTGREVRLITDAVETAKASNAG
jgi:hypothetical protein